MPGEQRTRGERKSSTLPEDSSPPETGARLPGLRFTLTHEAVAALRPFVDLAEVGSEGFSLWLTSILPLLPRPIPSTERSLAAEDQVSDRLAVLARALSDCASDRASAHFQASVYYADNQVLARRVKALEAMQRTRTRARSEEAELPADADADRAAVRYLPRGGTE